jgi:hypothetical protein
MRLLTPYQKPLLGATLNYSHPLAKGLVGCWLFNERGGVCRDAVYGNIGTLTNAVWKPDQSIYFDGTGDYVSVPSKNYYSFPAGQGFSIVCKFKINNTPGANAAGLVSKLQDDSPFLMEWSIYITSANKIIFQLNDGNVTTWIRSLSSVVLTNGTSYTFVGTFNGGTSNTGINHYINGVYDSGPTRTNNGIYAAMDASLSTVDFGAILRDSTYAGYLDGHIYYAMIYQRVLSPSEILSLYQSPYAMFQRDEAWLYKAPAAGGGWKPAWAARNRRTIGLGVI